VIKIKTKVNQILCALSIAELVCYFVTPLFDLTIVTLANQPILNGTTKLFATCNWRPFDKVIAIVLTAITIISVLVYLLKSLDKISRITKMSGAISVANILIFIILMIRMCRIPFTPNGYQDAIMGFELYWGAYVVIALNAVSLLLVGLNKFGKKDLSEQSNVEEQN